jgi:hypothetical protein
VKISDDKKNLILIGLGKVNLILKTRMNQQNAQINFWVNFIVQSLQHVSAP